MGAYPWTYLGPYAEFTLPLVTHKRDMCRQPMNCPNPQQGYCATCGLAANQRFHEFQNTEPDLHNILVETLNERFMTADGVTGPEQPGKDTVIYRVIPNGGKTPREFFLNDGDRITLDLSLLDRRDEVEWFVRSFPNEWEELRKHFPEPEFKWGFLRWYM